MTWASATLTRRSKEGSTVVANRPHDREIDEPDEEHERGHSGCRSQDDLLTRLKANDRQFPDHSRGLSGGTWLSKNCEKPMIAPIGWFSSCAIPEYSIELFELPVVPDSCARHLRAD